MFDWHSLLSLKFWFAQRPGPIMPNVLAALLVVFGVCLLVAVLFAILAHYKKADRVVYKLFKQIQNLFITLTVLGYLFVFFFWQQIPLLSSRFWLIVWVLVLIIKAGFIGRYALTEAPKKKAAIVEKEKFQKYLPKKKK